MSQGAGVTSAAAPPSSSIATTAAPLTSPTSVTIPQWKYDLLQRRKTNNCPKTIGAQHNHHQQQQNSLTLLKHGNNTCVSECSEGRDDRVTTKTSSPTHAHAADTVIMTMIKSPTHEHKQLVGHGNNNDEKQFQLQSNNEPNLSHFQFQPHSKNTAFNENNRKLFKKSCEVASFGGTNTVTGTTAVSLSSGAAVSSANNSAKSKKMVAVQEISDTITKELDTTFDSSEEFQYGPGIVSKLRYRYLTLTLRQNAQKQRANLDSLRRATSLNNLLDHDEEELDEEAEDDKKMMLQHNQHQQQNNEKQQITCQQQKPNAATTTKVANNKFMKQNQHSSVHFSSSVEQQQQRTARQIKRGNDTLKRARSVEALLCDNNNKSCNNNNNNRNSWNDSKSLMQGNSNNNNNSGSVTIEDKIHNARERNLLSLDKVPKRLTSIIDDTERPPPDLVKQTLKMFEATANRRGGPNRKANGEVAAKIATFKSIISQEKPIIIYPKPSSPKKSPLKLKIDNMVRKFTSTTPTSEEQPDIIPRKSSGESPTQSTSSVASPSPISELTKKIHNLSIIQTTNTTTIHNSNSVSEQNSCESDDLYDDDDQEEVHDDDDHDENIGEKVETIPETVEPLSVKRISKSALDNIAKAGTTQHFSFKTTTSSPLSTPPTKQIGVIRPIVAATNKGEEKLPLTSREIQKNMINDKKREEAAISNNNNSGTSSSSSSSTSPAWMSAIKKSNGSGGGGGGSKNHHQDNNTMVFNFKDRKEVPDYIENDGLLFRKRREMPKPNESGFVLLSDTCLDTSTDTDEMWQQMGPPSPCDVEFINANIIIDGKSSIRNRSTKELHYRVQFNDSLTSTFEYPSESSIMEEGDTVDYNGDIMNEDTSQYSNTGKMLGNLSLGSLGSYTPLKAQYQDKFELGVTRTQKTLPPPTQSATNNTAKNSPSAETVNEQDLDCLKPANDEDTVAYSEGVLKTDILF